MKYLFLLPVITIIGCGIPKTMESMNSKVGAMSDSVGGLKDNLKSMSDNMTAMKYGMRSQTLMIAIKEILSDDAQKYTTLSGFSPLPMVPAANAIAKAATSDELVQLFYLWISEINSATIDGEINQSDRNGIDIFKLRKLNAMQVIAGMIEDSKVEEAELELSGQFHMGAEVLLVFRHLFIKNYILENGLLTIKSPNKAELTAIDKAKSSLKQIESLPKYETISIILKGFYNSDLNQEVKIEPYILKNNAGKN